VTEAEVTTGRILITRSMYGTVEANYRQTQLRDLSDLSVTAELLVIMAL